MPWSIEIHDDIAVVEVVYFGVVTAQDIAVVRGHTIDLQQTRGLRNFLIDVERMVFPPDFSSADLLEILEQHKVHGVARNIRAALFASESAVIRNTLEFYETASVNRGWFNRAFYDREEALQWLLADTQDDSC